MLVRPRSFWTGVIVLAVVSSASLRASSESDDREMDSSRRFVRFGDYYLSASRIDYVISESDGLVVVFGSEAANRLKLTGSDAEAMRRWLEERAVDQRRMQQGGYREPQGSSQPQGFNPAGPDAGKVRGNSKQLNNPQGNNPPRSTGPQGRSSAESKEGAGLGAGNKTAPRAGIGEKGIVIN